MLFISKYISMFVEQFYIVKKTFTLFLVSRVIDIIGSIVNMLIEKRNKEEWGITRESLKSIAHSWKTVLRKPKKETDSERKEMLAIIVIYDLVARKARRDR